MPSVEKVATTRKNRRRNGHVAEPLPAFLKLDLGCGTRPAEGFEGVDLAPLPGVKHVVDLRQAPWPWPDLSVAEVRSSHFLEHLTGAERMAFMDELWRVLVLGGTATIIVPYGGSDRAFQDPTHAWPPLFPSSFLYFNRAWRKENGLDHYLCRCNFGFVYGFDITPEWAVRSQEARDFAIRHYHNVASDLHVTLTKEE